MFLWQIREIKNRGRNRSAQHRKERNGRLKIYSVLKIGINLGLLLLIALRSVQIVLILFYLGVCLCGRSADLLFCCVFSANLYAVWGNTPKSWFIKTWLVKMLVATFLGSPLVDRKGIEPPTYSV